MRNILIRISRASFGRKLFQKTSPCTSVQKSRIGFVVVPIMDNEFIWSVVAIEIDKLLKGIQIQGVGQENIIRRGSPLGSTYEYADTLLMPKTFL